MAEERVLRCDREGCNRRGVSRVKHYRVDLDSEVFEVDLCGEHAKPLLDFIAGFPDHFVVKYANGSRKGLRIHTIEEVEALKQTKPTRRRPKP